ncbi:MAG: hypothetical protein GX409_01525 [candidate division Zixibacteria bacterium]|jgi:hypothetical protein|nr:hypothetical protein [candidate division Zixibacteria bacterium]
MENYINGLIIMLNFGIPLWGCSSKRKPFQKDTAQSKTVVLLNSVGVVTWTNQERRYAGGNLGKLLKNIGI